MQVWLESPGARVSQAYWVASCSYSSSQGFSRPLQGGDSFHLELSHDSGNNLSHTVLGGKLILKYTV